MHSLEKLSFLSVLPKAYASSINNTPPKLSFITSLVFKAVCPKYPAIKSDRVTFLNLDLVFDDELDELDEDELDELDEDGIDFFLSLLLDSPDDPLDE